jgi:hypothetical protein
LDNDDWLAFERENVMRQEMTVALSAFCIGMVAACAGVLPSYTIALREWHE